MVDDKKQRKITRNLTNKHLHANKRKTYCFASADNHESRGDESVTTKKKY